MKYMGSKNKIAKEILPIILKDRKENQYYIEPFVGGANIIDKVNGNCIGSDNNPYLIAMWQLLQSGWIPPKSITKEIYNFYKEKYYSKIYTNEEMGIIGYVGFCGSYGGRFFDGGYAGTIQTKSGKRDYPLESYNNIMKQLPYLQNVEFRHCDYKDLLLPNNSIIYCDKPYENTKEYLYSKGFNHNEFWEWCRTQFNSGHTIFVSEYNAPNDFECVWEKEITTSLNLYSSKYNCEKLYKYKG